MTLKFPLASTSWSVYRQNLRRDAENIRNLLRVLHLGVLVFVLLHGLVHVITDVTENVLYEISDMMNVE